MNAHHNAYRIRTLVRLIAAAAGLAACSLSGCKMGPNYERPGVNTPTAYRDGPQGTAAEASLADVPWWELFNDDTLTGLVREGLASNYDVRVAVTRIEQARAIAAQARSEFFPQINYQGNISTGKNESLGNPTPKGGDSGSAALIGLNAVWELDLWGRIARSNEAALAQLLATEEAKRGVMLSVVTDIAQAYFELLGLDRQLVIARETQVAFGGSESIFNQRFKGGVASKLQVLRAQADVTRTAATVSELERVIALKENQICVLLGRNPGPIVRGQDLLLQSLPPEVPVGVPSTLLERRPDVRRAEQILVAANAQVGIAEANYFPRIGLTAALGRVSAELSDFSSGNSNFWSLAAGMSGPVFSGGRLDAEKAQAVAAWDQAKLQYQFTVLLALRDVSDSLVTRTKLADERVQEAKTVLSLTEAVKMAGDLYHAGRASYYELLEAQQQLFPAETALAQTQTNQLVVIVQLYKSLGGGWKLSDDEWMHTAKQP